jgi:nucleoside-diphosphate-sugar epimerase
MSKTVLVSGSTGYLGGLCVRALGDAGFKVRSGTRCPMPTKAGHEWVVYGDLSDHPRLDDAVSGCDAVVHFAGHAHVPETASGIEQAQRTNVTGTVNLATACAEAGVKRFVFISSALVVAGSRDPDGCITDGSRPLPQTAYARSKAQAEQKLRELCEWYGMDWVILRPPMVYGPRSPGNFHRLLRLVDLGLPLPLGRATGRKSVIFVDNLLSAVNAVLLHPQAQNSAFLVGDAEITSTADLIEQMAAALARPARLLPLPQSVCRGLGKLIGREPDIDRLFEPLYFGLDDIANRIGWGPPVRQPDGIAATVQSWREQQRQAL